MVPYSLNWNLYRRVIFTSSVTNVLISRPFLLNLCGRLIRVSLSACTQLSMKGNRKNMLEYIFESSCNFHILFCYDFYLAIYIFTLDPRICFLWKHNYFDSKSQNNYVFTEKLGASENSQDCETENVLKIYYNNLSFYWIISHGCAY